MSGILILAPKPSLCLESKYAPFLSLITSISNHYNIDKVLILAMCDVESAYTWNPWIVKDEPGWTRFLDIQSYARAIHITIATEAALQRMSWGLMQVMGTVARELGHSTMLTELCKPEVVVDLGCKKMRKLLDYYGNREDAISAYNQGGTKKSVTGAYLNQGYVDSVLSRMGKINEILSKGET